MRKSRDMVGLWSKDMFQPNSKVYQDWEKPGGGGVRL